MQRYVLQLLRQFDSIESDDVGRDGVRVVKGLCKSENFRNLDGEVSPPPPPSGKLFTKQLSTSFEIKSPIFTFFQSTFFCSLHRHCISHILNIYYLHLLY